MVQFQVFVLLAKGDRKDTINADHSSAKNK